MIRATLAAVALSGLLLADATPPSSVLVLGDSYASGEGLGTATGDCGTELARSWGALVAAELGAELQLLACAGAEVADVTVGGDLGQAPQLDAATAAPLVLLTLGGNDLGFVEIVADCLGFARLDEGPAAAATAEDGWTSLLTGPAADRGCDVTPDVLLSRIDGFAAADRFPLVAGGVTGSLADVYVEIANRTVTPGGELVVVGYPQLIAEPAAWPARYGQRCHALRAADAAALGPVIVALDEAVAAAAAAADDGLADRRVRHVSLLEASEGAATGVDHRLCGGGEPWINGLTVVEGGVDVAQLLARLGAGPGGLDLEALGARPSGSFHPASAGHVGIADAVLAALDD